MKARYMDAGQAGHGELVFAEALFPGEPWSIAIQRASDRKFLTGRKDNPWVGETIFLVRDGEARADGTLAIAVGPDIVDELDPQEQYALTLRGDGPEEKARLRVKDITYSAADDLGSPQPAAEPVPQRPVPQQSQPAPQAQAQATQQPQAQPQSPQPAQPLQMPPNHPAGKNKAWIWILLAALALIAAGAFLFLQNDRNEKPEQAKKEAPALQAAKTQSAKQAASAEEQVRQFFAGGNISPAGAVELAAKLPKNSPADQDAVYRLWYFAVENGETSVLEKYGECLDPSRPQFGSIEKNGIEAWNAYQKLRETEPQKAEAAMRQLRKWLEEQMEKGNAKARAWLEQIK